MSNAVTFNQKAKIVRYLDRALEITGQDDILWYNKPSIIKKANTIHGSIRVRDHRTGNPRISMTIVINGRGPIHTEMTIAHEIAHLRYARANNWKFGHSMDYWRELQIVVCELTEAGHWGTLRY